MAERPLEQVPLHDLLVSVEHHARDLAEHLELNFLPKLHSLDDLLRPKDGSETRDITIRGKANEILESDKFTQGMLQKMHDILSAVDVSLRKKAEME